MLNLSEIAILEKNKLTSNNPWILLFDVETGPDQYLRLCRNTENIIYEGNEYIAYPLDISDINENKREGISDLTVSAANTKHLFSEHLAQYGGLTGNDLKITSIVVVGDIKAKGFDITYEISQTIDKNGFLNFKLIGFNPFKKRLPRIPLMKTICRYKVFKGRRCQYYGPEDSCDRSLATCKALGNEKNFGGVATLGWDAIYY